MNDEMIHLRTEDDHFPHDVGNPQVNAVWSLLGRCLLLYQRIEYVLKYLVRYLPQPVVIRMPGGPPELDSVCDFKDTLGALLKTLETGGFVGKDDGAAIEFLNPANKNTPPSSGWILRYFWRSDFSPDFHCSFFALSRKVLSERNLLVHHFWEKYAASRDFPEGQKALEGMHQNAGKFLEMLLVLLTEVETSRNGWKSDIIARIAEVRAAVAADPVQPEE